MKFIQKLTKTNKILICVGLGVGVALGVGFVAGVSNTSNTMTVTSGDVTTKLSVTTGYANYGKTSITEGGQTTEGEPMNPENLSFPEFIKTQSEQINASIVEAEAGLTEAENQLAATTDPDQKAALQASIDMTKSQINFMKGTISAWNTSYALMIVGSVLLGIFGIAGIGWSTILLLNKKQKPTA